MLAFQDTDTPFNASMPVSPASEPALPFVAYSFVRLRAALGQNDAPDAEVDCAGFVVRRPDTTVGAGQVGWLAELLDMVVEGRLPLLLVGRVAPPARGSW